VEVQEEKNLYFPAFPSTRKIKKIAVENDGIFCGLQLKIILVTSLLQFFSRIARDTKKGRLFSPPFL
jgi:hypothetical protein